MDVATPAQFAAGLLGASAAALARGAFEGVGDRALLRLWRWAQEAVRDDPGASQALRNVEQNPGDQESIDGLALQIQRLRQASPPFADALSAQLKQISNELHFGVIAAHDSATINFHLSLVNTGGGSSSSSTEAPSAAADYGPLWPDIKSAFDWAWHSAISGRLPARLLARLWLAWRVRWSTGKTPIKRSALAALAMLLASAQFCLLVCGCLAVALLAVWRLPVIRRSRGSRIFAATTSFVFFLVGASGLTGIFRSDANSSPDVSPSPQTCEIRRVATGTGEVSTITATPGEAGFDLRLRTNLGALTVRPDFGTMTCATLALRELATSGFYDGRRCERLDNSQLDCFPRQPRNVEYGFRVRTPKIAVDSAASQPEGAILLQVDPQSRVTGLLSFICADDSLVASVTPSTKVGQVTDGLNLLNSIADAGTHRKDIFSDTLANKTLVIEKIEVIPWVPPEPPRTENRRHL
jgi:hypothetical protein